MSYDSCVTTLWDSLVQDDYDNKFKIIPCRKRGLNTSLNRLSCYCFINVFGCFWRINIDEVANSFITDGMPVFKFRFYRLKCGDNSRISIDCDIGVDSYIKCGTGKEYHVDYIIENERRDGCLINLNPIETNAIVFLEYIRRSIEKGDNPLL